MMHQVQSLGSR